MAITNIPILSLGAGVQSSTMALMYACGELSPMPQCAIFADTGDEPQAVYEWLNWIETKLPYPIHRVQKGILSVDSLHIRVSKVTGKTYANSQPPAFSQKSDGTASGLLDRHCTSSHKLAPIRSICWKIYREERKKNPGIPVKIKMLIGISIDEIIRMKPSDSRYIENTWPLIDAGMRRSDCLAWMKNHGFPEPPRSACVYCPFHNNEEWLRIKAVPTEWNKAVEYEKALQASLKQVDRYDGTAYLHPSLVPLADVDFSKGTSLPLFGNECEGMCGV